MGLSGADLERRAMLQRAGIDPDTGQSIAGARLEQLGDEKDVADPYVRTSGIADVVRDADLTPFELTEVDGTTPISVRDLKELTDTGRLSESELDATFAPTPKFPHSEGLYAFFPCTPDTIDDDGNLWSTEGSYGRTQFDLVQGTPASTSSNGPFGAPGILLSGASPTVWVYGGLDHGTGAGPFDLGAAQKFTVLALIKPTLNTSGLQAVCGAHPESGPDQARQWALYYNKDGADAPDAPRGLAFHMSDRGGSTPGEVFSYSFGASARAFVNRVTLAGATYDGEYLTQYIDGLSDEWSNLTSYPASPFPRRGNPMRLPWGLLYDPERQKGSIGASLHGTGTYSTVNPFDGELYGIWIYDRVLTPGEIARHQMEISRRMALPFAMFDFMTDRQGDGSSLVSDVAAQRRGWRSYGGVGKELSDQTAVPAWRIRRPTGTTETEVINTYLIRGMDANPGITYFPIPAGALSTKHLNAIRWQDLSASSGKRVLICKDSGSGPEWWVSNFLFDQPDRSDENNWTLAERETWILRQQAGSGGVGDVGWDANKWLRITQFDPDGGYLTNHITHPSGEVDWTRWAKRQGGAGVISESETTTSPYAGTKSRRYTIDTAPVLADNGQNGFQVDSDVNTPLIPGRPALFAPAVRPSIAQKLVGTVVFYNASNAVVGSQVNGSAVTCVANQWNRYGDANTGPYVATTVPSGAVYAKCSIVGSSTGIAWSAGNTLDADAAVLVQSETLPAWTNNPTWFGTAGASASAIPHTGGPDGRPIVVGAANTETLEVGDLLAVGFYCPGGVGTQRVDDLAIWTSTPPT